MGQKATFDPDARLITLTEAPVSGQVTLDVAKDLYSDGKRDWQMSAVLSRYVFPFRAVGGNPLPGGKALGAHYFLRNDLGWRIRPYEADQELSVVGNLWPEDEGRPVFVPTLGNWTVSIIGERSSLAISTGEQGLTAAQAVQLAELYRVAGLEAGTPVLHRASPAQIVFGGQTVNLTREVSGDVTVERQ